MSKYCEKCKKEFDNENASFCPICGTALVESLRKENEEVLVEGVQKKMTFHKKKMLSYLVYRQTDTEVEIDNQVIHYSQTIKKLFRKPRKTEDSILLSQIEKIGIKTKMDFWDTLYGIIFIIFGFIYPLCFLAAALFLFCGYGKVIKIKKQDGSEFIIPANMKTDDVKQLLAVVKKD
ncbi:MAG: hypothetical protein ACI4S1_07520 [Roseburia sp.]